MIRRLKQVRAGLVRATARAIVTGVRIAERASAMKGVSRARVVIRLSGPMHWFRTKTYIVSAKTQIVFKQVISVEEAMQFAQHTFPGDPRGRQDQNPS
jgi:hypothetical protein